MNKRDIPPEKLNELYRIAGSDPKLRESLRKGDLDGALKTLSPQDAQMVKEILADPKKLRSILSSPQAQQLIKQIKTGK